MYESELERQLLDACAEGITVVTCPECGCKLEAEPDALDVYCFKCDQVVRPDDSLVARRMI